jgi:hypothetical protein
MPSSKYALVERERRFLLAQFPGAASVVRIRRITDRYIDGTSLRLREQILAEAEFDSPTEADSLELPSFILREVSADARFTGGRLVRASRQDIETWLMEYGIGLVLL